MMDIVNRETLPPERRRIAVVGSYNRDITMILDRFPMVGETRQAQESVTSHGGKGSNQAVQARRFGVDVAMIAAIGDDHAGDAALGLWRQENIDVSGVTRLAISQTGTATIMVDADGQNVIVVDPGANAQLTGKMVEAAADVLMSSAVAVAQLETPQQATIAAFELARRNGVLTALNAAPMQSAIDPAVLDLVDLLFLNESEARELSVIFGHPANIAEVIDVLLSRVALAVILTLGADGAVLYRHGAAPVRQAAPAANVMDTTGAGDALIGAFVASYAVSRDLVAALGWGVAAGSFACESWGAVPSLGTKEAITDQAIHAPGSALAPPLLPDRDRP